MTPAIVASIWSNLQLALVIGSRIRTLEHNMKEGCWMVKLGRWCGRQQSDGYQSVRRCISEGNCWSGKTGRLEGYHLLGGSSGRLVINARGLGEEEMVVVYQEKSVVRISSYSAEKRGIKTSIHQWYRGQPSHDGEQALTICSDWKAILNLYYSDHFLCLSEASKWTLDQSLNRSNYQVW